DQVTDVLTRLMAQQAQARETERAIEVGVRVLQLEPLHEAAARRLMRLYAENGRRGLAMQLYQTLVDTLKAELNAQPEAETRAVLGETAGGGKEVPAPTAALAKASPASPVSPIPAGGLDLQRSRNWRGDGNPMQLAQPTVDCPSNQGRVLSAGFSLAA